MTFTIVSLTVRNYRSITKAYKLPLGDFSVLVGPNNEGKSNILRAIVTSLYILTDYSDDVTRRRFNRSIRIRRSRTLRERFAYDWETDFPVNIQQSNPDGKSEFTLEFKLSPLDFDEFKKEVKSDLKTNLKTNLKIQILLGKDDVKVNVLMKGSAKKTLGGKIPLITSFIGKRIDVQYIPSIRTSDLAVRVIDEILGKELAVLEKDPEYQNLVDQVHKAQKPILDRIGNELTKTVSGFIPEVKEISIDTEDELFSAIRRSSIVLINDGALTNLNLKGDGIKSLTAISLLKHTSQEALGKRSLVLCIEEPESHLHRKAIHKLRQTLQEMAHSYQIIFTTHSPSLVDKTRVRSNIIVKDGKGVPATTLADVRTALGVELSDNLSGAYLVILVEGAEDEKLLRAWLPGISLELQKAFSHGILTIDNLEGATNLSYKAKLYRTLLCNIHAFLDNDDAGKKAIEDGEAAGSIHPSEYNLAVCKGMPESEIEDFIVLKSYEEAIKREFGVLLDVKHFHNNKKKWSDRVKDCFETQGKVWSGKVEKRVKSVVAEAASAIGVESLNMHHRGPIDALIYQLEERIKMV